VRKSVGEKYGNNYRTTKDVLGTEAKRNSLFVQINFDILPALKREAFASNLP